MLRGAYPPKYKAYYYIALAGRYLQAVAFIFVLRGSFNAFAFILLIHYECVNPVLKKSLNVLSVHVLNIVLRILQFLSGPNRSRIGKDTVYLNNVQLIV